MTVDDIATVVGVALNDLPDEVQLALRDVRMMVVAGYRDPELAPHPELMNSAAPWKGIFLGTALEHDEDADDPSKPATPPQGIIFLNAAEITDGPEAVRIFAHEVGHAMGMDETEVEALGLVSEGDPTTVST